MDFKKIEKCIQDISKQKNIYSLANFDKVQFGDENARGLLSLIHKTRDSLNEDGSFDSVTQDLIYSVSSDIRFSLANAYLYFPHTNNYINETRTYPDGRRLPTYFMKIEDKRFFFYINTCFEKLYIFWDRVGDILATSFELDLEEREIYFSTVISSLGDELSKSEDGLWLKSFHDNEYRKILNQQRIRIVHYDQKDTHFYTQWMKLVSNSSCNPEQIALLQEEKDELLPLLKEQLRLSNVGFEKMVKFIADKGVYEQTNDG